MDKEVIEVNGKIIIEDENGKKGEIKVTNSILNRLQEILVNKNNIEYLEKSIEQNGNKIEALKKDITDSRFAIKEFKILQAVVTIGAFIGSVIIAKTADFTGSLAVAFAFAPTFYGIFAIPGIALKKGISSDEKQIDCLLISNALLNSDLEKEKAKEKKLPKLTLKKPTFKVTEIDKTELNNYKSKYSDLAELCNSIETVEAPPTKVPVKSRPYNVYHLVEK